MANVLDTLKRRLDAFQQDHPILAFPFATVRKFGDDKGGHSAALVAYYAFFAIFPLLLVMVTVLGILLRNNQSLQHQFVDSALVQFPVVGKQLGENVGALHRTGLALVIGLVGTFLGARGMAAAMQDAANSVWNVPQERRSGFPRSQLRSLALLLVVGIGLVSATLVPATVFGSGSGNLAWRSLSIVVSTIFCIGVFLLAFRLATASTVSTQALVIAAVIAAVGWELLQVGGTWIVTRYISQAGDVYGVFAVVIGLISWLYLAAMMTVYALEAGVVKERRLWPRSLFSPPLTPADEQTYEDLAQEQRRVKGQEIDVTFATPPGEKSSEDDASAHTVDAP